jgi:acetylornithine deacetylase/succinyl-diaminopimelate desuccinylase-like protein
MDATLERLLAMVDEATDELIELHQELVRLPTVNTGAPDSGNEIVACNLLAEWFSRAGIRSEILESAPSRGNLLAHIGGEAGPRLLLMSHVDVVPVEDESKWQHPPFSGEIVNGTVYGRGSDDAKSLASTGAMTLILLRRAGVELQGELRFLAAADEEAGGRYGIQWLAENHPEQLRADWAINEGGGVPERGGGRQAYFISVGEKGRMEAHFRANGRSGHGARPWLADNALYKLGRVLERIENYQPDIDTSLPTFQNLDLMGIDERPDAASLGGLLERLEGKDRALATTLRALSRMSIAPTLASGGIKSNSIPASASLTCDIRTLPHQDEAYVRRELEKLCAGIEGVEVEVEVTAVANASPYDSPFVEQLRRATEVALGGQEIAFIPALTVGFTDSRWVRPLGAEVYGYAPLAPGADTVRSGVHGVDEAMEIENLVLRTRMQVALAYLTLTDSDR